jgi:hypothetical protein
MSLSNVKTTSSENIVIFLTVNLLIPKYIPPFSVREARFEPRTCSQLCPLAGFETPTRYPSLPAHTRVGNFRKKSYSAEDGIDGTIGLFRRNSGCSPEQKSLGIPFRTVPQRRKMLGILHHWTKLEANARNSVLNHSAEEKTTRNFVPWEQKYKQTLGILFQTIPRKRQQLGIPFQSMSRTKTDCESCLLEQDFFVKLIFFHSISFLFELRNRLFRKLRNTSE